MNILKMFGKPQSAPTARDRLQILLSHERAWGSKPDLIALLREEIIAVVAKHVQVDSDKVMVKMDGGPTVSVLEIEVEIPLDAIVHAA